MFRRRNPPLDQQLVDGMIRLLMGMDAKLDEIIRLLDGNAAEDDT